MRSKQTKSWSIRLFYNGRDPFFSNAVLIPDYGFRMGRFRITINVSGQRRSIMSATKYRKLSDFFPKKAIDVQNDQDKKDELIETESDSHKKTDSSCVKWSATQLQEYVATEWPEALVHNVLICGTSCLCLSREEQKRLIEKDKNKKKPDKFKHAWLSEANWPIVYVEDKGFYCVICRKHNVVSKNRQNKKFYFAGIPSVRMKEDSIKKHQLCSTHLSAIETELTQKVSVFHKHYVEREETLTTTLEQVFATAFFLMKEYIANRKLLPMVNFMERVIGVPEFKFFTHRSEGSLKEIYLTIGHTIKTSITDKIKSAKSFGILTDKVTDISVFSQLVTFVQFWDSEKAQKLETAFLSTHNVLENFDSCDANSITEIIKTEIEGCGLDIKKMNGLSTDGASVMVGRNNGVAAKLREYNDKLVNIHCVCHRLALACTDTCSHLKGIKDAETVLRQLWYYFQNSPKRMAVFLKSQLELQKIYLDKKGKAQKLISRRLKKACQTRWLSFGSSVSGALKDFEAVLLTLKQLDDPTAIGLLKKMNDVKFLGILFILNEILPSLNTLSKTFQAGQFHFGMIRSSFQRAIDELKAVLSEKKKTRP